MEQFFNCVRYASSILYKLKRCVNVHFKNNRKHTQESASLLSVLSYGRFRTDRIAVRIAVRIAFACVSNATLEHRTYRLLFLIKLSVCSLIRYWSYCKILVVSVGRAVYYLCVSYYAWKLYIYRETLEKLCGASLTRIFPWPVVNISFYVKKCSLSKVFREIL